MSLSEESKRGNMAAFLGEGFHTAFRKVAFSDEAAVVYRGIEKMSDEEWASVLTFVAGPVLDYARELDAS